MSRSLLYVTLSRVTNLKGLYIIGKFNPPKSPNEKDSVLCEIKKLKEEKSLKIFSDKLQNLYKSRIIYQNERSLSKNLKNIISDDWYKNSDILNTRTLYFL